MKKKDVSVIIPVYNVEQYLEECLDSVINQTLNNIEIICVNDGSTDSSLGILEAYEKKDNRVRIISQENKGLSAARNTGMRLAEGKYIYYLDSDDYIEIDALEKLYQRAIQDDLDVLFCDGDVQFETIELKDNTPKFKKRGKYEGIYNGSELFKNMLANMDYQTQVSLHFAKREFLEKHELAFQEGLLYEDNIYTLNLILSASRAAHLSQTLFHYRIRENSIMTSDRVSFKHLYSSLCIYFEELKFVERIDEVSLRNAVTTQIEEIYKRIQRIYEVVKTQFLSEGDIRLLDELGNLEKTLMKQMGIEFKVIPLFPFDLVPNASNIILYGAGKIGCYYYRQIKTSNYCDIVQWVDKRCYQISNVMDEDIVSPEKIKNVYYDYIILAMQNEWEAEEVKQSLLGMQIDKEKIIWVKPRYLNI